MFGQIGEIAAHHVSDFGLCFAYSCVLPIRLVGVTVAPKPNSMLIEVRHKF